jgi:hypothetical protein
MANGSQTKKPSGGAAIDTRNLIGLSWEELLSRREPCPNARKLGLTRLTDAELLEFCAWAFSRWTEWLETQPSSLVEWVEAPSDPERAAAKLWCLFLAIISDYYEAAAWECGRTHPPYELPGCGEDERLFATDLAVAEGDVAAWATEVSFFSLSLLFTSVAARLYGPTGQDPSPKLRAEVEKYVHFYLLGLLKAHELGRERVNADFVWWSQRRLEGAVERLVTLHSEQAKYLANAPYDPRYGGIDLGEFARVARRDSRAAALYGRKRIERIFEQQLALIMQSFGFMVVPATIGERRVDLICLATGLERLTFLVEGKTSMRAYGLPTTDERALIEYVNDVRRKLDSLPEIQFVLLVGPKPARTLPRRLHKLEGEIGIPVRFISAEDLAAIRQGLSSGLRISDFHELLVSADHVLDSDFARAVTASQQRYESVHADLVRAILRVPTA